MQFRNLFTDLNGAAAAGETKCEPSLEHRYNRPCLIDGPKITVNSCPFATDENVAKPGGRAASYKY